MDVAWNKTCGVRNVSTRWLRGLIGGKIVTLDMLGVVDQICLLDIYIAWTCILTHNLLVNGCLDLYLEFSPK
jgi:predicted membrane-bound dolichyl-phosphate-mannose-protein mannosyltransferase